MTPRSYRLSGLLALLLVAACDNGGKDAAPKPAKSTSSKATPSKAGTKVASPTKAATPEVKAPSVDAKAPPTEVLPTEVPAAVPPTEVAPTEVPTEVAPTEVAPTEVAPTEVAPTEVAPAAAEPAEPVEEPPAAAGSTATATGAELSTPISLGPEAELLRLVLAHDMVKRQPVDPSTTFPEGQKVSLFIEARNEGEEPLAVRVTWENVATGRRSAPTRVAIGLRKIHRTRAFRTMRKAGSYRAIVLGEGDQELAILPFTVE